MSSEDRLDWNVDLETPAQRREEAEGALGPRAAWPPALATAASFTRAARQPAAVLWGPTLRLLANEAWRRAFGPPADGAGETLAAAHPDIAEALRDELAAVREGRAPQAVVRRRLRMHGEAADAQCVCTPIHAEAPGAVAGVALTVSAARSTEGLARELVGMRRMDVLRGRLASARDLASGLADIAALAADVTQARRAVVRLDSGEQGAWPPGAATTATSRAITIAGPDGARLGALETEGGGGSEEDRLLQTLAGTTAEFVARFQAAAALRASDERLRQFGEASSDVLWIRDARTLQLEYLTPAYERIYGVPLAEAMAGDSFDAWLENVVPEDRARVRAAVMRVAEGETLKTEFRIRRRTDGQIRWLRNTDFPLGPPGAKPTRIGGIAQDFTERRARAERLEAREESLRSAMQVGGLALWDWNIVTNDLQWSDEHFRMEGYAVGEVTPSYEAWADRIHPDDRAETEGALAAARDGDGHYAHEFRVLHPDGSVHWLQARGRFFYDRDRRPTRMVGAMIETTRRREWEERQSVLIAELQHRTRNLMGVVRSISEQTLRGSSTLADFRTRFRNRMDALARVQDLLSQLEDGERITIDTLVRSELTALGALGSKRIHVEGPSGIALRSSSVQTFALALHELATNAGKYGALKQAGGRLQVTWRLEDRPGDRRPWLRLDWVESGVKVKAAREAVGAGHGRELIEKALPYQLGAETAFELTGDGVRCAIAFPVSGRTRAGRSA